MNNNHRRTGNQRLLTIRLILAATGMALGGMFAVVAKEAADAEQELSQRYRSYAAEQNADDGNGHR